MQNQAGSERAASKNSGASSGNFSKNQTASERKNIKRGKRRAGKQIKKNPCLALGESIKRQASEQKNKRRGGPRASRRGRNFSRFAVKNSNIEKKAVRGKKSKTGQQRKIWPALGACLTSETHPKRSKQKNQKLILMDITNLRLNPRATQKAKAATHCTPWRVRGEAAAGQALRRNARRFVLAFFDDTDTREKRRRE
ncbi:hypothetical protein [Janthinobacterium psychrotolerans]|uniref:hypothetical protein n=1 Tax=Janthinobacterium psychrotolerans TaxID=1747903 RepID=UPI0012372510|nr:hypothetical protein [Janthinobacterium psychrotolerans]